VTNSHGGQTPIEQS